MCFLPFVLSHPYVFLCHGLLALPPGLPFIPFPAQVSDHRPDCDSLRWQSAHFAAKSIKPLTRN